MKAGKPQRQMRRKPKPASKWPRSVEKDFHDYCLKKMPAGAIKADLTKHAPHNSYGPPMWYEDQQMKCVDCGREFVFTARQQKRWFEVFKIPIHVVANRCVVCRGKRRNKIAAQKRHMEEMAKRPVHPSKAFFRKKLR